MRDKWRHHQKDVPFRAPLINQVAGRYVTLPLVMLSLTSRCNNRCLMCSYWQKEPVDFPPQLLEQLASDLQYLTCRNVGLTGGEPLLYPHLAEVMTLLKDKGCSLSLMTNGALLSTRFSTEMAHQIDHVYISLDGPDRDLHDRIRGVHCFDQMMKGLSLLLESSDRPEIIARCTIQRENWRRVVDISKTAESVGFDGISYVGVDTNSTAYGRTDRVRPAPDYSPVTLNCEEARELSETRTTLIRELLTATRTGFIRDSPHRLDELFQMLGASSCGGNPPDIRCSAPLFSLFIAEDGQVSPCFFRPSIGSLTLGSLRQLCAEKLVKPERRRPHEIRLSTCRWCTCPLFRGPVLPF